MTAGPTASERLGRERAERLDLDALGRADLEADVAGDDLERLADLARDVVADAGRVGDVVEVAAAGVGHRLEEDLVEVLADPERRRAHAAGAQLAGVAGELVAVGDPRRWRGRR